MLKNFIKKCIFQPYSKTFSSTKHNITDSEFKYSLQNSDLWYILPHIYEEKLTIMAYKKGIIEQYSVYNHQTKKLESLAKYSNTIPDFQKLTSLLNTLLTAGKVSKAAVQVVIPSKNAKSPSTVEQLLGNVLTERITSGNLLYYQIINLFLDTDPLSVAQQPDLCQIENVPFLEGIRIETIEELENVKNLINRKCNFACSRLDSKEIKTYTFTKTATKHVKHSKTSK